MAVDCADNLYVASHSKGNIHVFNPDGEVKEIIQIGPNTTNVAFGGPDLQTLLITTAAGLYKVRTNIKGFVNR